jgi:deazaflavin-dependent oxidoreductase (nitroreductase family)
MGPVARRAMRAGSRLAVRLYRWSGGRIGGKAVGGTPVLLLTVQGRKSGQPHTTAVGYFEHAGGYLVVGSAGGLPKDPQWFKNLRVAREAGVEIGRRAFRAEIRELHGVERDTAWHDVVLRRTPAFGKYEVKTGRTMPIALLTPVAG